MTIARRAKPKTLHSILLDNLARRIEYERVRRGETKTAWATRLGLPVRTYFLIEKRCANLQLASIEAIADKMNLSSLDLVSGRNCHRPL